MPAYLKFDRPVGALADLAELQYISALHQTSGDLREDGSIDANDVSRFLMSRYGVKVSPEVVQNVILRGGICGAASDCDDSPQDDEAMNKTCSTSSTSMDLLEMVAVLFVPHLLRLRCDQDATDGDGDGAVVLEEKACPKLIALVTEMILHDVTGDKERKELSVDLIRSMFLKYGEKSIAENDALLNEMLLLAATTAPTGDDESPLSSCFFDAETFLTALTSDVRQYDVRNESRMSTNWCDVFGANATATELVDVKTSVVDVDNDNKGHDFKEKNPRVKLIQRGGASDACNLNSGEDFAVVPRAQAIDFVASTYYCKVTVTLVWSSFVFTYMAYVHGLIRDLQTQAFKDCQQFEELQSWGDNNGPFRCNIQSSIVDWLLLFVSITLFGSIFVGAGSIGNGLENQNLFHCAAITVVMFFATVFPPVYFGFANGNPPLCYLRVVTLIIGIAATVFRLGNMVEIAFPSEKYRRIEGYAPTVLSSEAWTKRACAFKIAEMQTNATKVLGAVKEDSVIRTYFGQALTNFAKLEPETVSTGGFRWTWSRLLNKTMYTQEGIFYSARFTASNFTQYLICTFILLLGIATTKYMHEHWIPTDEVEEQVVETFDMVFFAVADNSLVFKTVAGLIDRSLYYVLQLIYVLDEAGALKLDCLALGGYLDKLCSRFEHEEGVFACNLFMGSPRDLCGTFEQLFRPENPTTSRDLTGVFNTTSLQRPFATMVSRAVSDNVVAQANKLYPQERYMVTVPFIVGTIVAFILAVGCSSAYLPSITSTILKFRSGVIPTLKDSKSFSDYHYFVIKNTMLSGSMFWGIIAASMLVGAIIGGIVFFFLWQVTAYLAQKISALIIGVTVCLTVKWLVTFVCRQHSYRGFYRTKPFSSNVIDLVNECFNFATSIAFVLARMVTLVLLAALFVGHVDYPFLAPKVGEFFGGLYQADLYHKFFEADLLATEAHRHPYIERLGVMYLYKLKYRHKFMTKAGSCWRLLFVTALMPWLQKYRLLTRGEGYVVQDEVDSAPRETSLTSSFHAAIQRRGGSQHSSSNSEANISDTVVDT